MKCPKCGYENEDAKEVIEFMHATHYHCDKCGCPFDKDGKYKLHIYITELPKDYYKK